MVVWGGPDVPNRVTDGGIEGERHVTETSTSRRNEDSVDGAGSSSRGKGVLAVHGHGAWWCAELGHAFYREN